jgi:hypothetical protein
VFRQSNVKGQGQAETRLHILEGKRVQEYPDSSISMAHLWDPLWEYVLEDYSDDETAKKKKNDGRKQRRRQQQLERRNANKKEDEAETVSLLLPVATALTGDDGGNSKGNVRVSSWRRNRQGDAARAENRQDDDDASSDHDAITLNFSSFYPNFFDMTSSDQQKHRRNSPRTPRNQNGSRRRKNQTSNKDFDKDDDEGANHNFWNMDFFDVRDDECESERNDRSLRPAVVTEGTTATTTTTVMSSSSSTSWNLYTPPNKGTLPKKSILRRSWTAADGTAAGGHSQRSINSSSSSNLSKKMNPKTVDTEGDDDDENENGNVDDDSFVIVGARTYMTGDWTAFGRK